MRWLARGMWLGVMLSFAPAAWAQGIDCSKARSPTEKAICASPALLNLDHEVAVAYADTLARQPDRRDAIRQDLLRWLKQRDAACAGPTAGLEACLSRQLTARLAVLSPPVPTVPAASPPALPATGPVVTSPAVVAPADPAIPQGFDPPAPAARLDQAALPAADQASTLLHVTSPGRFAIAAKSPGGTALQLIDMLAGPGDVAGAAGSEDGRLDVLLDVGDYKLLAFSAPGATGSAALTVTPFHPAAPSAALPRPGRTVSAKLSDAEQLAFWLVVPPGAGPNVQIEAAGRSLADLRLWQDGRELTALTPESQQVEPVPGHGMTDLRLVGRVEPGTYLAIAYGGRPLRWADGGTDQPFHLRSGQSPALAEGWAGGTIGPFGSEVFARPRAARLLQLTLPASAAAELTIGDRSAAIAKTSRTPSVTLPADPASTDPVEVRGAAGQPYVLQALESPAGQFLGRPGTYWVGAATTGMGGDEIPPTVILELREAANRPARVVASTAPRIGPGLAWHGRFNLRGPSTLIFQTTAGSDIGLRNTGITMSSGQRTTSLPAGYVDLDLTPNPGVQGVVDTTVGPVNVPVPALPPTLPPNPVIPLGVQTVGPGQSLTLSANQAPGAAVGLSYRPVPVALVEGPLLVTVVAGTSVAIPVAVAPGGTLAVTEVGAGPVPFGQQGADANGRVTVVIPISDTSRTVALAWRRNQAVPPPIPNPSPVSQTAALQAGTPVFLELNEGGIRGYTLTVAEGGQYRVETLGRLHTAGRLATPFLPKLGTADGNGVGHNMLIQSMLRAGRYRVAVTAIGSSGHLGVTATPAPLLQTATLRPGGSVRATVPAGSGTSIPVTIDSEAERFHLDVASRGTAWAGRLEDPDGWPLTVPGPLDGLEQKLKPGHYRILLAPDVVDRQVALRLTPILKAVPIEGHGPHALPFAQSMPATWREPAGRDQPRLPDQWIFTLAGQASSATVALSDGMAGILRRDGVAEPVARVVGSWKGALDAGRYVLDTESLGRNDRLAYTVQLDTEALQPNTPRDVALPSSVNFSLADSRVVSLTSWGNLPVKAVLRRADGGVVGRYGARADDWNIAVSRRLPAGRYVLDLAQASPPDTSTTGAYPTASSSTDDPSDGDADSDKPDTDDQAAQTKATTGSAPPTPDAAADPASDSTAASPASDSSSDDAPTPTVSLTLSLPPDLPIADAPVQATVLVGQGVHGFRLPQAVPGSLVLAQATAPAPAVLALERQSADGWRTVAIGTGRTVTVASPADDDPAAWRVSTWTIDGGPDPVTLVARVLDMAAQPAGPVQLSALDGMPAPLAAARVRLDAAGLVTISSGEPGLMAGAWPGHTVAPPDGSTVISPDSQLWLLASRAGPLTVGSLAQPEGTPLPLSLPAGLVAPLPASPSLPGRIAVWRAESGLGQPGLGAESGLAQASAVALASRPAALRNASTDGQPLRIRLTRLDLAMAPIRMLDVPLQAILPPGGALPVMVPAGDKQVQLDLAPGVAAFADWQGEHPIPVWTGPAAVTRTLDGNWTTLLLVNTGAQPAPARVGWQPAPAATALRPGIAIRRFYGAAGSFALALDAPPGARLQVAGDAAAMVINSDGSSVTGTDVAVDGPARAVVTHSAGPVAVWLDAPGASPWPAATAQAVVLPGRVALTGLALTLAFTLDQPSLVQVSTTAPVLLGVGERLPVLYGNGAELPVALPAGQAELRFYPASDGPLTGTATVTAESLVPLAEGVGNAVAVAPGGAAAFSFTLAKAATVGVGVRAEPDSARVRLLDRAGKPVGLGVAQLHTLPAGQYYLEASVPASGLATLVRPALVGTTPRGNGPPPDVAQHYLELVGMKPEGTPR